MKIIEQQRVEKQAENAGFEFYVMTRDEDHGVGAIYTNTKKDSPFNGECLDIFEDGTVLHYSQFKGEKLKFSFSV